MSTHVRSSIYRSAYSYCYCGCGFEHEYEYDSKYIDDDMLDKLLDSIMNGKCLHAKDFPTKYLRTTSVSGLFFASAVGILFPFDYQMNTSQLFKLKLNHITLINKKYQHVVLYCKFGKGSDSLY